VFLLVTAGVIAYLKLTDGHGVAAASQADVAPTTKEAPSEPAVSQIAEPACSDERECAIEALRIPATVACRAAVEHRAQYDIRWEDGLLGEDTFTRAGWADETKTSVTFAGDAVSFQNGFGAFARVSYFCTVDRVSKAVVGLQIARGRLPQPTAN